MIKFEFVAKTQFFSQTMTSIPPSGKRNKFIFTLLIRFAKKYINYLNIHFQDPFEFILFSKLLTKDAIEIKFYRKTLHVFEKLRKLMDMWFRWKWISISTSRIRGFWENTILEICTYAQEHLPALNRLNCDSKYKILI